MEVCIQTGKLVYKYGVLLTKENFYLQRGTLALQTGNSKFNFPPNKKMKKLMQYIVDMM